MGGIVSGQGESGTEVLSLNLVLDVFQQSGVNFLLEGLSGVRSGGLGEVLGEESLGFGSLVVSNLLEGLIGDLVGFDAGDADLGGGAQSVSLVHSSHWDSVDLVWSGDGNQSRLKLLQGNNSLASESSCEEDKDSTWLDTASKFWSFWSVSNGVLDFVFSGVPIVSFDHLQLHKIHKITASNPADLLRPNSL